jgi:hypothetical protein
LYKFLDVFFTVFHTCLIVFNLFGWAVRPLRRANLVTLLLTGGSWFVLGIFYGWGYCPFTDWHWKVLHRLGRQDLPDSYTQYLIERVTGIDMSPGVADALTVVCYFIALAISLRLSFRKPSNGPSSPS